MFKMSESVASVELETKREMNRATAAALRAALGLALLHCSGESTEATNWERMGFSIVAAAGQTTGSGARSGSVSRLETADVGGGAAGVSVSGRMTASAAVRLNEVKFDPPGNDGDYEFVELLGEPLTTAGRRWLVAIEGDRDANPGLIDVAIDLSGCTGSPCQFDEQGLLVLAANLAAVPANPTVWRDSAELAKGGLENGTTSLILLEAPPESILGTARADWDTDDDGRLELPDGWLILDSVSWTDSTDDLSYASTSPLGPKPKAQALWRCRNVVGDEWWAYGQLLGEASSLTVDAANSIPPGIAAVTLTPGAPNQCPESAMHSEPGFGDAPSLVLSGAGAPPIGVARAGATVVSGSAGSTETAVGVLSVSGGGRSTTAQSATHRAGSESILVVTARISSNQAGSTGWWSPNPYASAMGGGANQGGSPPPSPESSKGDVTATPTMPSGCEVTRTPVRRPMLIGLLGLAIALSRRCRGRRR